jgi:hypothetical protein
MSRNSSGTYTLPAGNPVVSGQLIEASWANSTLNDIATALTDSLSRSGEGSMSAPLRIVDGSAAVPGIAFGSETGSGAYRAAAGDWYLTVLGSGVVRLRSSGVDVTADNFTVTSSTSYYPQSTIKNKTNDANASYYVLDKDRAGAIVQSGDILGNVIFRGYDGATYLQGASIIAKVAGTPGTNDMPGSLSFLTTADGDAAPTERFYIAPSGPSIARAGLQEKYNAIAASAIDMNLGNYFSKTISGATTFSVSNVPTTGTAVSFILDLTNAGSSVTWWSGVKWAGGTAPTLTTSGRDSLGFYTWDGGTTWTGLVLGKDVK